ncbi:MAG: hybrid sensor histidine kinase/response regulator [Raineya sp.]
MKIYLIILLLSIFTSLQAANDILVLNENTLKNYVNPYMKILEDKKGDMTLQAVRQSKNFRTINNTPYFHLGLSNSYFWLHGKIKTSLQHQHYVLLVEDPSISFVELYLFDSQGKQIYYGKSGAAVDKTQKSMDNLHIAFPLDVETDAHYEIVMRLRSHSFLNLPIKIQKQSDFVVSSNKVHFYLGGFYALMLLIILYNFLAFLFSKDDLLLYFTLSSLFFTISVATYDGMLSQYCYFLYKWTNYSPYALVISLALAFTLIFSQQFLNIPPKTQLSDILKVLTSFYFLNTGLSFVNPFWGINVLIGVLPIYFMMILWGFVWAYQNKIAMAKNLMTANVFLIVGGVISLINLLGYTHSSWWANYGVHIGYLCYILVISFGITGRLNRIRLEVAQKENQILKEKAKKEIEREKNAELERIVQERTQTLKQQNEELVKLNAELDRFVYSISHELSSPLKSLIGLIQLMKQDTNPDSLVIYLEMQEKSIKKLDLYTRELTDLLRNARIDIQKQRISFRELLNQVLNQRKSDLGYDKVKKIISIRQEVPFVSDKNRIAVLLGNMVSNGIQYHRTGIQSHLKIQIEVSLEKALITISDNGIGIGKEHLDKIYNMFYRASERSQGSGLGLYIVKETILKLNGKIDMHSEINVGTIFKIEIPNLIDKNSVVVPL